VGALAVYRIAELIAIDDGPWDLFLRIRDWAGSYDLGEDGRPKRALGRFLKCPYCLGIWVALALAPVVLIPSPLDWILIILGLAGAQALFESVSEGRA